MRLDVRVKLFSIHNGDPWRTGIDRVARRDNASCSEVNNREKFLWINTGIVAIPSFR